jgi:hypothetical protein
MGHTRRHDPIFASPDSKTRAANSFAKSLEYSPPDRDLHSANTDEIQILVHVALTNPTNAQQYGDPNRIAAHTAVKSIQSTI